MEININGKKRKGKSKKRWIDGLECDIKITKNVIIKMLVIKIYGGGWLQIVGSKVMKEYMSMLQSTINSVM